MILGDKYISHGTIFLRTKALLWKLEHTICLWWKSNICCIIANICLSYPSVICNFWLQKHHMGKQARYNIIVPNYPYMEKCSKPELVKYLVIIKINIKYNFIQNSWFVITSKYRVLYVPINTTTLEKGLNILVSLFTMKEDYYFRLFKHSFFYLYF